MDHVKQRLPLIVASAAIVVMLVVTLITSRGPKPKTTGADPKEFSAFRATGYLEDLLENEKPHPAGSKENDRVRERLVSALNSFGLSVEIQSGFDTEIDVELKNILARYPGGDDSLRPLIVASHYDSVPQGPGAGDAASCVAAMLETIRAMKHHDAPERPVYFLITDGEELGMRGARLFVEKHSLAKQKPFVLNFEARGASGPSLTFETHVGNYAIVDDLNATLPWPKFTGSSFVTVYRLMPNATDFVEFEKDGWEGVNSAFIGSPHRYHTPEDTIENLSQRTLQHHGEKMLALTLHFARLNTVPEGKTGDAVFFDLMGLFLIWWPVWCSIPICAIIFVTHIAGLYYRSRTNRSKIDWYPAKQLVVAVTFAMIVLALCGFIIPMLLRAAGILDARFTSWDQWIIAAYWLVICLVLAFVVGRQLKTLKDESVWNFVWTTALAINLVIAIALPGFCYFMILPGIAVALMSWIGLSKRWCSVLTSLLYSLTVCPTLFLIGVAFGPGAGMVLCPVFALLCFPVFPAAARSN